MSIAISVRAICAAALALQSVAEKPGTPLHPFVDAAIMTATPDYAVQKAPLADDAEFLRRVFLDLTGAIPTADQARTFIDDPTPDKRAKLVDRLLASSEHARHLAYVFDNLLMDRRPDKHVPAADWTKYLRESFALNKRYDVLAREILSSDGVDARTRPAAKFILDRDAEPHQVTRDISRVFLGMNLTCAQCHDHPKVASYKQGDYYGIFAFISRTSIFTEVKPAVLAEKADGDATFASVFDPKKENKTASMRLPGGAGIHEPKLEKGKEYKVAPAKGVRPVPQFSRRGQLAPALTQSRQFARATANRVWAMIFGRGLVDPVDFDHPSNPPSHPVLLDKLTDELIAHRFNLRWLMRELVLTQTYQRSSAWAGKGQRDASRYHAANIRPLSPEQLALSLMEATGLPAAQRNDASVKMFVATFGGKPGDPSADFQATLDQTLFVANGPLLRQWLAPKTGNLTDRLAQLRSDSEIADELFLRVLTRRPTPDERAAVAAFLRDRTDRLAAMQEMAWALLASAEFRFNH